MCCVPVGCMFSETAGGRHETRLANAMWTMSIFTKIILISATATDNRAECNSLVYPPTPPNPNIKYNIQYVFTSLVKMSASHPTHAPASHRRPRLEHTHSPDTQTCLIFQDSDL